MRSMKTDVRFGDVNWGTLRHLLPHLTEFRLRLSLAMLCLVLAKLASVGLPFVLKHIVDDLDSAGSMGSQLVSVPLGLLLAYGVVRFSNVLFGELRDTLFGRITERAMRRVGLQVFRHLHSLDLDFHLNRKTGGLSRDIERGTNGIAFLLRFMVFNIVPTLLEVGLVVGLLLWNYDVWFAVIVVVAVIVYIAYSVIATEWRTRFIRAANLAESESSTRAIDSLLNYETVKYFTNEAYESRHYDDELARWETARRQNRLSLFALNGGQSLIIAAAMTAAMVLAAYNVRAGAMTLGDFVLINAFMMQVFMPLNFLGFVYREMKGSMANIEAMFRLLQVEARVTDSADASPLQVAGGEIEFRNVSFHYQAERPILKGVSFRVPARAKVAVVGSSGAGKSTLAKLLFRFYDVTGGAVLVDGQDVRSVTQQSLRQAIGVVPQECVLFNMSLFENVRYGQVDATDEEVWQAIRLAHLEGFVKQLPKGADTLVGERGLKLSGGEKQRVAIARAILKRPPVMVFDEATSSLDSESEKLILQAIREISAEQTSLVIAHRLSTVIDADQIVVLDQGQVVEQGSHEQLLQLQGHYARLWALQQRQPRSADSGGAGTVADLTASQ
ncbi:ABC transporter ATP-binding protein/permease [Pseudomaricurvus sp. HS19]|uniref:ABCB family ABC transporter ATP-binding protein/permease n=1 Tax=Pseudomaricurvus sp. HS19 TaxID=2692626 RepID=UPI00136E7D37|nr:ABC transporter ATP-binding protein/permease [Pseudomaricurvus sp. HS19]MYM62571.1 ATP-binding cassette domain-containing protein [Pseudomaricurvus sp. HS19]